MQAAFRYPCARRHVMLASNARWREAAQQGNKFLFLSGDKGPTFTLSDPCLPQSASTVRGPVALCWADWILTLLRNLKKVNYGKNFKNQLGHGGGTPLVSALGRLRQVELRELGDQLDLHSELQDSVDYIV